MKRIILGMFVALFILPSTASALTMINDGDAFDVLADMDGHLFAPGAFASSPQTFTFSVSSSDTPTVVLVELDTALIPEDTVVDFVLSTSGGESTSGTVSAETGTILFSYILEGAAAETLTLSYSNLVGTAFAPLMTVAAQAPVPAALPLFISALGGGAFMRRRRKVAA